MAVGVGFEPTMAFAITVFKTAAFVHSAIPPTLLSFRINYTIYKILCQGNCHFFRRCIVLAYLLMVFQGFSKFLHAIPVVRFVNKEAAYLGVADVHGASVF